MAEDVAKVYTTENPINGALLGSLMGQKSDPNAMYALMANGGMGAQWNNPMWLIWAMLFGGGRFGMGGPGDPGLSSQISNLQGVVQDNHNSDLLMQGLQGNTAAITQLAGNLNVGATQLSQAISNVRDAITAANGNIQLAAQQMISNNNLQSAALGTQIGAVGNGITREILQQGYQGQLASQAANYQNQINNLQQSSLIQSLSQQLQNALQNGFTQIGFQSEKNACQSQQVSTANTQRIIDTLNNHWNLQQQTEIQQLKDEIGRLNQSNQLISALKGTATATSTTSAS